MKRPGDMRRRRQAAYRRGFSEALFAVAHRVESLRASGHLSGHALLELQRVVEMDPPEPTDDQGGGHEHRTSEARRDLRA